MIQIEEIDLESIENYCRVCWTSETLTKSSIQFKEDYIALKIINFCCPSAEAADLDVPLCEACVSKFKEFKTFWMNCYNSDVLYNSYKNKSPDINDFVEESDTEEKVVEEILIDISNDNESVNDVADRTCNVCYMVLNSPEELMNHTEEYNHRLKNNSVKEANGKIYKMYKCIYCPKMKFRSTSDFRRHIIRHIGEKPHCCDICGTAFTAASDLKRHSLLHEPAKPFPCSFCEKEFTLKLHLANHVKFVHNNQPITCDICKGSYRSLYFFKKHLSQRHKVDSNKPLCNIKINFNDCDKYKIDDVYKCPECEEEFDFESTFQEHTSTFNDKSCEVVKNFINEEIVVSVDIQFSEQELGDSDSKRKRKRKNQCDICDTICETPEELKQHIKDYNHISHNNRIIEPDGPKRGYKIFKCLYCDRTKFDDKTKFKRHLRFHTGEKLLTCDVCGKGYQSNNELSRHALLHKEEKPHRCDICGKGYTQKANLKIHMKDHEGIKYECEFCGEVFLSADKLKKHQKLKHSQRPNESGCPWKPDLKKIKYTDYRVKNVYYCPVCKEKFVNGISFKAHAQNASSKLLPCQFCDKKFHSLSGLHKHYRNIHNYDITKKY